MPIFCTTAEAVSWGSWLLISNVLSLYTVMFKEFLRISRFGFLKTGVTVLTSAEGTSC